MNFTHFLLELYASMRSTHSVRGQGRRMSLNSRSGPLEGIIPITIGDAFIRLRRLCLLPIFLIGMAGVAHAQLVDQECVTNQGFFARFGNNPGIAQSFMQVHDNITGASVLTNVNGAGIGDVTIALYDNLPPAGGKQLASGIATNVSAGNWATVSFGFVSITPEQTYYLVISGSNPNMGVASTDGLGSGIDLYPRGQGYYHYAPVLRDDIDFQTFYSGINAPTNLQATQIGFSGDQIQLSWDYGSDPIDGFELDRQTSSQHQSGAWPPPAILISSSNCSPATTGLSCAYTDTVPTAYATYNYRLRAYKGTVESSNSDEAAVFQLMLSTISNNREMLASFQPDANGAVIQVANAFGFNHFNWISWVTHVPNSAVIGLVDFSGKRYNAPPPALVDPAPGGWAGQHPADQLLYYWDEQSGFDANYSVFNPALTNVTTAFFSDWPGVSLFAPLDEYYTFTTQLVGANNAFGAASAQYTALATFYWSSNFHGKWGIGFDGITDFRFSNLDPPITAGDGSIFNVQLVSTANLPPDIRTLLVQTGAQGVSTAPYVDTSAPMTAAFFSGPRGKNGWYMGPLTVTLIATDIDGPSDIIGTSFSVDTGSLTAYVGPFTLSADGIHKLDFGSVDRVGNVETPRPTQQVKIDGTAPSVTVTADISIFHKEDDKIVRIAISGSISDLTSGVNPSSTMFAIKNEDGISQAAGPVTVGADGKYSFTISFDPTRGGEHKENREHERYEIAVSAQDNAGNQGSSSAFVVDHQERGDQDNFR
jgi:hypothetical protein